MHEDVRIISFTSLFLFECSYLSSLSLTRRQFFPRTHCVATTASREGGAESTFTVM
jgi:hypothetical protein